MSDAFVDVSWRGLEVGKRIKLRAIHAQEAYLDHTTPMPVGTVLAIRTDDGVEIPVSVMRVHEQVGGSSETPGMQVAPRALEGAAKAWWDQHAAVVSPAVLFSAQGDPRAEITSRPTLTMTAVEMERTLAATGGEASRTEVMPAINPETLDGVVETSASEDGLIDDGRRTMAMSAVDISAIVEMAEAETSGPVNGSGNGNGNGEDDAPSGDGPSGAGATTKKRRGGGKRSKRR